MISLQMQQDGSVIGFQMQQDTLILIRGAVPSFHEPRNVSCKDKLRYRLECTDDSYWEMLVLKEMCRRISHDHAHKVLIDCSGN